MNCANTTAQAAQTGVAKTGVALVADGIPSNGGVFRGGAYVDGKLYIGAGGHFDGAINAGAKNINPKSAKGISVFEKDGKIYWANDSISLPQALTPEEISTVQSSLENAFPDKKVKQIFNIEDAIK